MDILTDFKLGKSHRQKYMQIAEFFIDNISRGNFKNNQQIPSINEFSKAHNCSRDTVEKGYKVLKDKRAVKVIKGKGTFIDSTKFVAQINVLFLINKLSTYKLEMYDAFCESVDANFQIDFEIYNCDEILFKSLLERNVSLYDYYIVMPHFRSNSDSLNNFSEETLEVINSIPSEKLIIMDNNELKINGNIIEIFQDFEQDVFKALTLASHKIVKYSKLKLAVSESGYSYLNKIKNGFSKYCFENKKDYVILDELNDIMDVNKGDLFIVVEDSDLVKVIDLASAKNLKLGSDIGIISYNETPLKRLLGIAVMSTDFKKMGSVAANMIINNIKGTVKNPFNFIDRESL